MDDRIKMWIDLIMIGASLHGSQDGLQIEVRGLELGFGIRRSLEGIWAGLGET